MNFEDFKKSLNDDQPPEDVNGALQAMWWDAKGEWDKAHETAQEIASSAGSWVHAYLHRKEGDESNASYWYSRAQRPKPSCSLKEEWEKMVRELLQ